MKDEEEAMELSGESSIVSNLHNFSFDVSWSTSGRDISPPLHRRGHDFSSPIHRWSNILSPARFNASTPVVSNIRKSMRLDHRTTPGRISHNQTVKVSHKTVNTYHAQEQSLRRQSFSPMELEQSDHSLDNYKSPQLKKRLSDFGISYLGEKSKTIPAMSQISEYSLAKHRNINNNLSSFDFDLEDSVFCRKKSRTSASSEDNGESNGKENIRKKVVEHEIERKSSHVVILVVMLISACMGVCLYLQVGSCAVFDVDTVKLRHKLEDNVFGQHIAVKTVIDALEKFEQDVKNDGGKVTLVMSFHGWTGIGKNFVSQFIAESFYNARVFWYLVPLHFAHTLEDNKVSAVEENDVPTADRVEVHASGGDNGVSRSKVIKSWIVGNVTKCGVNVFIFDEMDKASKELLDGIQSAIETLANQKQAVGEKNEEASPVTVILFLSNSRASQINQYLFSQTIDDRERELIQLKEFKKIFDKSSAEWYDSMKMKHQVDYFVPFLPLAESHVRQCIERDFVQKGRDPGKKLIENVMNELSFFDMGGRNGQMSLTGCKRVQDKVDLHLED